jgi:ribokinase
MKSPIVVVGSLNMDFVVRVPRLPAPGETTLGDHFLTIPGGKGANQANAAARLGGSVRMAGRVGDDVSGGQLKASLAASGVDVSRVHATKSAPTGIAMIWVDDRGQNSIVVAPGANATLHASDAPALRSAFDGAACALFQFETPLDAVAALLRMARAAGAMTILDPAPAQSLDRELFEQVDILTPNETEACILLRRRPEPVLLDDAPALAAALLELGPRAIILKLGDRGCFYAASGTSHHAPAFAVNVIDSTAAGDTFNGAFAVARAGQMDLFAALRYANAAAALSATRAGAQSSAPSHDEVTRLLAAD